MTTVLFAGGGTGGHLMPALAIAEAMVRLEPGIEPFFVGAERGVEARVLPARRWRHVLLPLEPIYRRQWWRNAGLPFSAWRSLRGLGRVLAEHVPALAVGTGGYVSGLSIWAAARRGIPVVLQEQNAIPGFATRRLAHRARQIHLGFPEARQHLRPGPDTQVLDSGNPIVPPPTEREDRGVAKEHYGFQAHRPLVVVVGGSQGSLALNRAVAAAIGEGHWPSDVQLLWQTGQGSHAQFERFTRPGLVRLEAFLDPMGEAYAAADLVVCRSGAMTLAELAAWGLPAVLVPLPTAAANHQLSNARALASAGAAVLLEQHDLTGRSLASGVAGLLASPARMADLSRAVSARARPGAAEQIAGAALHLLHMA